MVLPASTAARAAFAFEFALDELHVWSVSRSTRRGTPPSARCMTRSWSASLSPGNMGCPSAISPIRHPIAKTSTFTSYAREPRRSSGARYHRVATYSVRGAERRLS